MLDKQVCPNCGQLYDTGLTNCPLCGAAAQVIETEGPGPRKRITEAERKQRRAERKEAEQEARRRRKDERLLQDAEEERQLEEASRRRKEERRKKKEAKKAAKQAQSGETSDTASAEERRAAPDPTPTPVITPGPARTKQRPVTQEVRIKRDRTRTPRIFLILSVILLTATIAVGGSYLLWKLDLAEIPWYDELAAKKEAAESVAPPVPGETAGQSSTGEAETEPFRPGVNCTALTLDASEITLTHSGDQTQIVVSVEPADTTDERVFHTSDESVVKVSQVGIVTAVSPGSAVITVTCGTKAAQCTVICDYEDNSEQTDSVKVEELRLNNDDMTFFHAGENYVLTVNNVPAGTAVEWMSLDESVATVDQTGYVVAVGAGTTRIIAFVGDLQAECWVRCRFE